ncbi:MAG: hypothetical protein IIW54_00040 [Lachnospiraceae bacterium]|nr:hypothetical protein [Lachnospiraceae bacterium]MBQ5849202.1 hypothetical protein [Lachnospiraceae bacterium]
MGIKINLPCEFGTKIYSIIGENVPHELIVDEFRVTKDEIYIISDGYTISNSKIGIYYFFDKTLAEHEIKRKREKYENGKRI